MAAETRDAVGELLALAEPWLWTAEVTDPRWFDHHRIEGIVKMPPSAGPDTPAWALRSRLLDRADQFIEALAATGWQLMDRVRMEFVTDVKNFTQTLAGVLVEPSQQKRVTLTLYLTVGRPL